MGPNKAGRHLFMALALVLAAGAGTGWAAPLDEDTALRDQALRLNDVTGEGPMTGQVLALAGDPAHAKKLLAAAVKMAKAKDQPFQINATYMLAQTARAVKDLEAGEFFYRLHAEQALKFRSGHHYALAYAGLSKLFYDNKKFEQAEKVCRELLELPLDDDNIRREKSDAIRRLVMALARQDKTDDALRVVDALLKGQPDSWLLLEMKGEVLHLAGKSEEAIKTYEEVLDLIAKDKSLKDDEKKELTNMVRYPLSGVYVDAKQVDKAAEQLKVLLAAEPDNPTYNNDLGYIWADNDLNLAESEKMIRKALDEDRKLRKKANPNLKPEDDKDSAAYLDSLGWVLFKQKKYEEAKKYLLQAAQDEEGQHVEILDHLAEVHLALGEKAKAVEVWKKALTVEVSGKREQQRKAEVEKKLKANQ